MFSPIARGVSPPGMAGNSSGRAIFPNAESVFWAGLLNGTVVTNTATTLTTDSQDGDMTVIGQAGNTFVSVYRLDGLQVLGQAAVTTPGQIWIPGPAGSSVVIDGALKCDALRVGTGMSLTMSSGTFDATQIVGGSLAAVTVTSGTMTVGGLLSAANVTIGQAGQVAVLTHRASTTTTSSLLEIAADTVTVVAGRAYCSAAAGV